MRSFSEEEADKFVMKHHKHGGKEKRDEEKTEGESGLMKNKADGEQSIGPGLGRAKENGKNAQLASSTHGMLIIHQYGILVLTLCQCRKQNDKDQNEAAQKPMKGVTVGRQFETALINLHF